MSRDVEVLREQVRAYVELERARWAGLGADLSVAECDEELAVIDAAILALEAQHMSNPELMKAANKQWREFEAAKAKIAALKIRIEELDCARRGNENRLVVAEAAVVALQASYEQIAALKARVAELEARELHCPGCDGDHKP